MRNKAVSITIGSLLLTSVVSGCANLEINTLRNTSPEPNVYLSTQETKNKDDEVLFWLITGAIILAVTHGAAAPLICCP